MRELGLAVEIKIDYRRSEISDEVLIVSEEEIERGMRKVMEVDGEVRKKVREMSEKSIKALMEGGSSRDSLKRFVSDVVHNLA